MSSSGPAKAAAAPTLRSMVDSVVSSALRLCEAETPPIPTHSTINSLVSEYQSHPASSSASNAPLSQLELLLARGRAYEHLVKESREVVERATTLLRWASTQHAWTGELQHAWAGEAADAAGQHQHQRTPSGNLEAPQASANRARLAQALQREKTKSRRPSVEAEPAAAAPAPIPPILSAHPSFLPSKPSESASQAVGGAFLNSVSEEILRKKVRQRREAVEVAKRAADDLKRSEQTEQTDSAERLAREQALRDRLLKDKKPLVAVAAASGAPSVTPRLNPAASVTPPRPSPALAPPAPAMTTQHLGQSPPDISVPVRIFVQATGPNNVETHSTGSFWLVFRRRTARFPPSLVLSTIHEGATIRVACIWDGTTLDRILVPAPVDVPLCLLMRILNPEGEESTLRVAFNHRHPAWNRVFCQTLCAELATLPSRDKVVTMTMGAQLGRLHALEHKLASSDHQRSNLTVLSIPLSIWTHGKNLSKQCTPGQRFRLFYLDPVHVDPSAPLVYLEDIRGEMDPVIILRGEIAFFKLPPVGSDEVVFEVNCSALAPSNHFAFKIVLLRCKVDKQHSAFNMAEYTEFERRASLAFQVSRLSVTALATFVATAAELLKGQTSGPNTPAPAPAKFAPFSLPPRPSTVPPILVPATIPPPTRVDPVPPRPNPPAPGVSSVPLRFYALDQLVESARELQGRDVVFDQEVSPISHHFTISIRVDDRVLYRFSTKDSAIRSVGLAFPREDSLLLRFEVQMPTKIARLDCILATRSPLYVHDSLVKIFTRFRHPMLAELSVSKTLVSLCTQLSAIVQGEQQLRARYNPQPTRALHEARHLVFDLLGFSQSSAPDGKIKTTSRGLDLAFHFWAFNSSVYIGTTSEPDGVITLRLSDVHRALAPVRESALRKVFALDLEAKRSELANVGLARFFPDASLAGPLTLYLGSSVQEFPRNEYDDILKTSLRSVHMIEDKKQVAAAQSMSDTRRAKQTEASRASAGTAPVGAKRTRPSDMDAGHSNASRQRT